MFPPPQKENTMAAFDYTQNAQEFAALNIDQQSFVLAGLNKAHNDAVRAERRAERAQRRADREEFWEAHKGLKTGLIIAGATVGTLVLIGTVYYIVRKLNEDGTCDCSPASDAEKLICGLV
jgi:hypothetical protein